MPNASFAPLRAQLQEERDRLRNRLQELGRGTGADLSFDPGFADSSQVTAERAELEALSGTLNETLGEIETALHKIDEGTYGRCESCGGPIAEARLEAMPAARLCITCASKSR
jgi:RNA polymerase-binding transcription factor DksA